MSSRFERLFEPFYRRVKADIFDFCDAMNFEPTWQQALALKCVMTETRMPVWKRLKRIAIKSGQGPGKTTVTVIIALWRALQDVDALVVVTAPSMKQCTQVWMAEARRLMDKADPLLKAFIKCYATRIEIGGRRDWGVWTATASRPENLQGFHQTNLTFIVDEASGVSAAIIQQIKGTLSNPDSLLLMIGNPNTTSCDFYNCFTRDRALWHTFTYNAEDTARDYPHIVHPSRNRLLELEYGRDSDPYRIRVLGEFPLSDPNTIMDLAALEFCTKTSLLGCASIIEILPQNQAIGIDFARYGSDESVIARRSGLAIVEYSIYVKKEPREVVDAAFRMQHVANWGNKTCFYIPDADGMGQGVMFAFHEAGKQTYEFRSQVNAADTAEFSDQLSEAWFGLRRVVNERICHLPNDPRLIQQLSTRQYYTDKKGRLKVETKDEWRKRLEITESPDRADAVVQAFYNLGSGAGRVVTANRRRRQVGSSVRRNRG